MSVYHVVIGCSLSAAKVVLGFYGQKGRGGKPFRRQSPHFHFIAGSILALFVLSPPNSGSVAPPRPSEHEKTPWNKGRFSIVEQSYRKEELTFWERYGIDSKTLQRFRVKSLSRFESVSNQGKPYTLPFHSERADVLLRNGSVCHGVSPIQHHTFPVCREQNG